MKPLWKFMAGGALTLLILTGSGCGGRQEQETIAPPEPPPPTDYRGRLNATLRAEGIDPDELACNTNVTWASGLRDDATSLSTDLDAFIGPYIPRRTRQSEREMLQEQVAELAMNWFIRTLLIHGNNNNLGAVVLPQVTWTDDAGQSHPLVVFHSATTPNAEAPDSCFRSLVNRGRVQHAINLYDGNVPLRDLIDAEGREAEAMGITYVDASNNDLGYRGWRAVASNPDSTDEQLQEASATVARLIREQILAPGGNPPQGNVYFHCAGGMHRSPLISGILRRCVAGESMDAVDEAMRLHAAYGEDEEGGGFEAELVEFVRNFECSLIQPEPAAAPDAGDGEDGDDGAAEPDGEDDEGAADEGDDDETPEEEDGPGYADRYVDGDTDEEEDDDEP